MQAFDDDQRGENAEPAVIFSGVAHGVVVRADDQRLPRRDQRRHSGRRRCRRRRSRRPCRPHASNRAKHVRQRDARATGRCRSGRRPTPSIRASRSASAMIRAPKLPPAVAPSRHWCTGSLDMRALLAATGILEQSLPRLPWLNAGQKGLHRGNRAHRVVERRHSLAARYCRHRLDRQLVLFHPSRSQPQARAQDCPRASRETPGRCTAAASITW